MHTHNPLSSFSFDLHLQWLPQLLVTTSIHSSPRAGAAPLSGDGFGAQSRTAVPGSVEGEAMRAQMQSDQLPTAP
jgi:hypothetical protein